MSRDLMKKCQYPNSYASSDEKCIITRRVEATTEDRNELIALLKLNKHNNIQHIIGYDEIENNFFLKFRCFCITLKNYIDNIRNSDIEKLDEIFVIRGIVEGLKYLHDNQIIHKNICPSNIGINAETNHVSLCNIGFDDVQDQVKITRFILNITEIFHLKTNFSFLKHQKEVIRRWQIFIA
jgi:serine/threonine protein kinase